MKIQFIEFSLNSGTKFFANLQPPYIKIEDRSRQAF